MFDKITIINLFNKKKMRIKNVSKRQMILFYFSFKAKTLIEVVEAKLHFSKKRKFEESKLPGYVSVYEKSLVPI